MVTAGPLTRTLKSPLRFGLGFYRNCYNKHAPTFLNIFMQNLQCFPCLFFMDQSPLFSLYVKATLCGIKTDLKHLQYCLILWSMILCLSLFQIFSPFEVLLCITLQPDGMEEPLFVDHKYSSSLISGFAFYTTRPCHRPCSFSFPFIYIYHQTKITSLQIDRRNVRTLIVSVYFFLIRTLRRHFAV